MPARTSSTMVLQFFFAIASFTGTRGTLTDLTPRPNSFSHLTITNLSLEPASSLTDLTLTHFHISYNNGEVV